MSSAARPPYPAPLDWAPLPRIPLSELSYERFLREFALPKHPFILTGASEGWPAAQRWGDLAYFQDPARVRQSHKVSLTSVREPFRAVGEKEKRTRISAALERLEAKMLSRTAPEHEAESARAQDKSELSRLARLDKIAAGPAPSRPPLLYIKTWDYVRGGAGVLQQDFSVPSLFDRSPAFLSEQAVLGSSATDMKWLYIGEGGTGSGSHIDTNNSSAWLWVARGRKRWRCIHGSDWCLFSDGTVPPVKPVQVTEVDSSDDGDDEIALPDLFQPDPAEFPALHSARLFEGVQEEGDICYNPTQCIHAVQNLEFTVSLTHNYIDASNLGDALRDVTSTWEEDRPMVLAMGKREREKFWSELFGCEVQHLPAAMVGVRDLVSATAVEAAVEAAAQGDEAVSLLLHSALAPTVSELKGRLESMIEESLALLM